MIDGDLVVHEVELSAPPEEVFQMFVDPARLTRWIGRAAELEPRPGGRFRFEIEPGQYCEGEYVARPATLSRSELGLDRPLLQPPAGELAGARGAGAIGGRHAPASDP